MGPKRFILAFLVIVSVGAASAQKEGIRYLLLDYSPDILSEEVHGLDEQPPLSGVPEFGELPEEEEEEEKEEKLSQSTEPSAETSDDRTFVVPLRAQLRGQYGSPMAYSMYTGGLRRYVDIYNRVIGNNQRYRGQKYAATYNY